VGALLDINSQTFLLTAADDYVFDFLERPDQESFQSIIHCSSLLFIGLPLKCIKYIPRVPQCLSSRRNWDLPPRNQRGGGHSPADEELGGGGPNSDDWMKGLALCLLCGTTSTFDFISGKNSRFFCARMGYEMRIFLKAHKNTLVLYVQYMS
jgi:hypothetical protein